MRGNYFQHFVLSHHQPSMKTPSPLNQIPVPSCLVALTEQYSTIQQVNRLLADQKSNFLFHKMCHRIAKVISHVSLCTIHGEPQIHCKRDFSCSTGLLRLPVPVLVVLLQTLWVLSCLSVPYMHPARAAFNLSSLDDIFVY